MEPVSSDSSQHSGRLTPFERIYAPILLTWVQSDHELFWLAPQTPSPLTVQKIEGWTAQRDDPFLFWQDDDPARPIGYGELNRMPRDERHLWLGHLIIAPSMRGSGWGTRMTRLFLQVGFEHPQTEEISLVVFPENLGAIRCYKRAGMEEWGEQHKTFGTSARRYRMIHMGIKRGRFEGMQASPGDAVAQ